MSVRDEFNPKREIREPPPDEEERRELAEKVTYTGSPYHKRNPGDFGLSPPAKPRADKTHCDEAGIFEKSNAQRLLERGVERGMISKNEKGGFPKHIWSVTEDGIPLEAQREDHVRGTYHGYPLLPADPFHVVVLEKWEQT